ncbi:MAG: CRISPR-associated endoribonuclease Cas6 [Candidatus Aenigmatarchaeota archaeon]
MRLLLELESIADAAYDLKYYHKVQGLIYNSLRDTKFSELHDLKGYKYFCFSNIFPIGDFKKGDKRKLVISSPNSLFIETLKERLSQKYEIHIGDLAFKITNMKTLELKFPRRFTLINSTPIILRIKPENAQKFGITRKAKEIYWRPGDPIDLFIKQLEENIIKKYTYYNRVKLAQEFTIFEILEFDKAVVNHFIVNGREKMAFGSIWKFKFNDLSYNKQKKNLLKFAVDCGFGERNTFGFGFMNVAREENG